MVREPYTIVLDLFSLTFGMPGPMLILTRGIGQLRVSVAILVSLRRRVNICGRDLMAPVYMGSAGSYRANVAFVDQTRL